MIENALLYVTIDRNVPYAHGDLNLWNVYDFLLSLIGGNKEASLLTKKFH